MAEPCAHTSTSPSGRAVSSLTNADPATAGLAAVVTVETCHHCRQLVARVELKPARGAGPGYSAPPAVLVRDHVGSQR